MVLAGGGRVDFRPAQCQRRRHLWLFGWTPFTETATVRFGQLQALGAPGLTTNAPPTINAHQYDAPLPASVQGNVGIQMAVPWWKTTVDVLSLGQHSYDTIETLNINAIDMGAAFLPSTQDPTAAANPTPGAASLVATNPDLVRSFQGLGPINLHWYTGWRTYHSLQLSLDRRFQNGVSFGLTTRSVSTTARVCLRLEHPSPGVYTIRSDDAQYQELFGNNRPARHVMKGNFVWDLPDISSQQPALRFIGRLANDWQLSGVWTGRTSTPYTINFIYTSGGGSVNLTGSPDYPARVRVLSGLTGVVAAMAAIHIASSTPRVWGPLREATVSSQEVTT